MTHQKIGDENGSCSSSMGPVNGSDCNHVPIGYNPCPDCNIKHPKIIHLGKLKMAKDLDILRIIELKALLHKCNLTVSGRKTDLINRIVEAHYLTGKPTMKDVDEQKESRSVGRFVSALFRETGYNNESKSEEMKVGKENDLVISQINANIKTVKIDERLQTLLTHFPNKDIDYLVMKANEFELNEKGDNEMKRWIEHVVINKESEDIIESRFQSLRAFLPDKDSNFLKNKSSEFSLNESGNCAFNAWLEKNQLAECKCCYDTECLESEMLSCSTGHLFCKECISGASNVAIGDGKTFLNCLTGGCTQEFDLVTLSKAVSPPTFSNWLRKIQAAEAKHAGLAGLEQCPFCPFVIITETVPIQQFPVFICQHPACGKKSCRLCHEVAHVPLRCEEVEKDAEVAKRTYIENKMTEALIRVCYNCQKPFIKHDGCNKMTCDCGASMCYLCRKPVKDYSHFVGQGGTPEPPHRVCLLYTDNNTMHTSDVARGALEARQEMQNRKPDVQLRYDPTVGFLP